MKNSILKIMEKVITEEDYRDLIEETPYIYNNKFVPRVTSILSNMLHEEYLMKWSNYMGFKRTNYKDVSEEAAIKGSYVHNFIENYISNGIDPSYDTITPPYITNEVTTAFNSFLSWWDIINKNNKIEILMQEESLICEWFGGTLDLLLKINGKIFLMDFKTSNHASYKYFLQLSAYRYMLYLKYGIIVDGVGIIMLNKKEILFKEYIVPLDNDYNINYMNQCQETFFSLVYAYYNRLNIENMTKEVMKG